ncbi:MAG: hypothetical protein O3A46_17130 [Candidatus Poribacteria bacterium]|nr:hypothetical protein [Candidatus Poribacteria bacterium]
MNLTTVISLLVIGAPLTVLFLFPIVKDTRRLVTDRVALDVAELMLERERSYTALTDLDFDHECGKISDADYDMLRQSLMEETAHVLAEIDGRIADRTDGAPLAKPTFNVSDDALEREIARFKESRGKS